LVNEFNRFPLGNLAFLIRYEALFDRCLHSRLAGQL